MNKYLSSADMYFNVKNMIFVPVDKDDSGKVF